MGDKLALPEIAFLALLIGLVATACWTDIFQRKIPNWVCAVTALAGLAYVGVEQGWQGAALALAHLAAALIVTMALFAMKVIGAGDAKFYAAIAAWLPIDRGLLLLAAVGASGLILLVVFLVTRLNGRTRRTPGESTDFDKLPYGVAIGFGGLVAVLLA
ncbi:prepilin peptidase [Altererythrobacter sp. TH136]|uniref:A24 family peptidase n=1 Tax=Altererythrobacter sp. TH136 TaxID=2067415 RepID=UPI00143DA9D1|nr:prepilin peptidase [Altererythrobacter sp. TH136]